MEKQKTYPLYISKEEEIAYKKKLSRNMVLFSLLISGLGILVYPLLLLGGLGVFISLMAWMYYSNVEYKESIKPVLYKEDFKEDKNSEEDSEVGTPLMGLGITLSLSAPYATDDDQYNDRFITTDD